MASHKFVWSELCHTFAEIKRNCTISPARRAFCAFCASNATYKAFNVWQISRGKQDYFVRRIDEQCSNNRHVNSFKKHLYSKRALLSRWFGIVLSFYSVLWLHSCLVKYVKIRAYFKVKNSANWPNEIYLKMIYWIYQTSFFVWQQSCELQNEWASRETFKSVWLIYLWH